MNFGGLTDSCWPLRQNSLKFEKRGNNYVFRDPWKVRIHHAKSFDNKNFFTISHLKVYRMFFALNQMERRIHPILKSVVIGSTFWIVISSLKSALKVIAKIDVPPEFMVSKAWSFDSNLIFLFSMVRFSEGPGSAFF